MKTCSVQSPAVQCNVKPFHTLEEGVLFPFLQCASPFLMKFQLPQHASKHSPTNLINFDDYKMRISRDFFSFEVAICIIIQPLQYAYRDAQISNDSKCQGTKLQYFRFGRNPVRLFTAFSAVLSMQLLSLLTLLSFAWKKRKNIKFYLGLAGWHVLLPFVIVNSDRNICDLRIK